MQMRLIFLSNHNFNILRLAFMALFRSSLQKHQSWLVLLLKFALHVFSCCLVTLPTSPKRKSARSEHPEHQTCQDNLPKNENSKCIISLQPMIVQSNSQHFFSHTDSQKGHLASKPKSGCLTSATALKHNHSQQQLTSPLTLANKQPQKKCNHKLAWEGRSFTCILFFVYMCLQFSLMKDGATKPHPNFEPATLNIHKFIFFFFLGGRGGVSEDGQHIPPSAWAL